MKNYKALLIICSLFFLAQISWAQPPNDFCSGAIPITPSLPGTGCSTPVFILPFAFTTESGVPAACNSPGRDQWFTWTATADALSFTSSFPGLPGISIYANCANTNQPIFYDCALNGGGTSLLSGWNIGDNLIIQIYGALNSSSDVAFCLEEFRPINDVCSGAIPISPSLPGTGCSSSPTFTIPFTTDGTTDSGVPTVCVNPGNDQWFTWTATATALQMTSLFPGLPGIAIFDNCADASAGNEIACLNSGTTAQLSGWDYGDNLLIQIYDFQGADSDVAFCLEEVRVINDVCSGAIPITPSSAGTGCSSAGFTLPFTTDNTNDSGVPTVCNAIPGNDQWFTWTATTDGLNFTSLAPGDPGIAIFANCSDANSGNEIACLSTFGVGVLSGWNIGDNLLIHIYDFEGSDSDVAFCLEEFALPPANDLCGGAIPITPSPAGTGCSTAGFTLPFSTDGTTTSGVPMVCTAPGNDQWFTWTATTDALNFTSLSLGLPGIAIFANCTDADAGNEIDCALTQVADQLSGWNIGDNLIIQIYDFAGANSDVAFCLEEFTLPPANDFCAGAIPITPTSAGTGCSTAGFTLPFTTDGTTDSGVPQVCSTPGNDQWFTWTATTDALNFTSLSPGLPGIAIFANCADADAGNEIDCTNTQVAAQVSGWDIGDNLIIQIYDFVGSDSDVAFCLEEAIPITNDACNNALVVTAGAATATGTTLGSTNVEGISPCTTASDCSDGSENNVDFDAGVWFVYTSSAEEDIVIDTEGSDFDTQVQIFTGTCGSLTCLAGDDDAGTANTSKVCFTSAVSATPVDYYIYLDGFSGNQGSYVLNISTLIPLPITLLSFQAEKMEKTNLLTWVTGTEENTESHVIERSANGSDWEVIGEVAAAGFSVLEQNYEFIDRTPLALSYYRLKSIDFDDAYQVSDVLAIQRKERGFSLNEIFPNPVNQMLLLEFNNDQKGEVEINVSDLNGRILYITQQEFQQGINHHEFDVSKLPAGIYLVNINNGTTQLTRRIVKVEY